MASTLGRTVRINDALWETAMHQAEQRGETVTDVIRGALETYIGVTVPTPNAAARAAERKLAKIRELVDC